jgi:transcriptional regulator with XRE-family HTH domain
MAEKIQQIIATTLQSKPKGRTQWSCRSLAQRIGVSKSTVSNIWRSHNLKPHRVKTFKLSRDPHFLEKLTDVVGLYLNPPEQAMVLCVDEKSQIQGPGSHPTRPTDEEGALWDYDPRLQAQRDHHINMRLLSLRDYSDGLACSF